MIFLLASSIQAVLEVFIVPVYFPSRNILFPDWRIWYPEWALTLLGCTAILLFMPKIFLSFIHAIFISRTAKNFQGDTLADLQRNRRDTVIDVLT